MSDVLESPRSVDCEPEWQDRPVSAVATHISMVYHEFTRDQLPLIAALGARVATLPGGSWKAGMAAFGALVTQLRDAIETHAWTEDDILFPVLVAHEYPGVLATNVSREELGRLVGVLASEHLRIRQIISAMDELTEGFKAPSDAPVDFEDLMQLVQELTISLLEELDLEDRCLLPRARAIASGA